MGIIRDVREGLVDLIYPKTCHACGRKLGVSSIDGLVCSECWSKIKTNPPPFCHTCGRPLDRCADCLKSPLNFDRAFSPCVYEGVIKELIHEFKYKNRDYLGPLLAKPMIEFIKEYSLPIEFMHLITAVPLSRAKMREREFNHSIVLAREIAKEFGLRLCEEKLLRVRNTKNQVELNDTQRLLNVKDAFSVKDDTTFRNKNVLLVDDVLTTGSTASEAAGALKQAGANSVYVLTLAN